MSEPRHLMVVEKSREWRNGSIGDAAPNAHGVRLARAAYSGHSLRAPLSTLKV